MITIHQLQKRFGKTAVLQDLELTVPTGKISALLGPNGTGKTTTIKCAMNLISPDAGSIEVCGVSPNKLSPAHWQRIGYVSENQKMPDWLSISALLDYLRPLYEKHWDRSFEKKLLADFDLPMHQPLRTLSRGQRMKAALLSSLAYRPQLVVLDEPFAGLDPLVRGLCGFPRTTWKKSSDSPITWPSWMEERSSCLPKSLRSNKYFARWSCSFRKNQKPHCSGRANGWVGRRLDGRHVLP
jgi:ABC-type nitrate/sulfonate/bicarbonate transport system ATPase subunit